jgi:hypothetical protein
MELLAERGLPVPPPNPDPIVTIAMSEKRLPEVQNRIDDVLA